jgi:hypothetical protein
MSGGGRPVSGLDLEVEHLSGVNAVERAAVALVQRREGDQTRAPHRWSERDLEAIAAIRRRAVIIAAVAGALTGAVVGLVEIAASRSLYQDGSSMLDNWRYWATYLAVAAVVSVIEIAALYWLVLRQAGRVSEVAGLALGSRDVDPVVVVGLSRAALEVPNPRRPIYGIDPFARLSRWRLIGHAILYRLKVGATSFVLRLALRRLFARAALRSYIPLVAVPVFAIWNAVVIGWVMREVQVRAAGPLAIADIDARIRQGLPALDAESRLLLLRVVAETIVRSTDAHPNFVLLVQRLLVLLEIESMPEPLPWAETLAQLGGRSAAERRYFVEIALATCLIDGRVRRDRERMLGEVIGCSGFTLDRAAMTTLRAAMVDGQGVPPAALGAAVLEGAG